MATTHTYTVSTTNLPSGTLYWKIVGTGTNPTIASDFTSLVGSVTIAASTGDIDVEVEYNAGIEKNKTFKINLYSDSGRTNLVHESGTIKLLEPVIASTIADEAIIAAGTGSITYAAATFKLDGSVTVDENGAVRNLTSWYTPSGSDTPGNIYDLKIQSVDVNVNHTIKIYTGSSWVSYTGGWESLQSNLKFKIEDSTGTGINNVSTFLVVIRDSNSQTTRGSATFTFTMQNGSYPVCENIGNMWRTGGPALRNDLFSARAFAGIGFPWESSLSIACGNSNTALNRNRTSVTGTLTLPNKNAINKNETQYSDWTTIIYRNYGNNNGKTTDYVPTLTINGTPYTTTDLPTQDVSKVSRMGFVHVNLTYRSIDTIQASMGKESQNNVNEQNIFIIPGKYQISHYKSTFASALSISNVSRNDFVLSFAMDEANSNRFSYAVISSNGFQNLFSRSTHWYGWTGSYFHICNTDGSDFSITMGGSAGERCVQALHLSCIDGDDNGGAIIIDANATFDITGSSSLSEPPAGTVYDLTSPGLSLATAQAITQNVNSRDTIKVGFDPDNIGGWAVSIAATDRTNCSATSSEDPTNFGGFGPKITNFISGYFNVRFGGSDAGSYLALFKRIVQITASGFAAGAHPDGAGATVGGTIAVVDEYPYTVQTTGVDAGTVLYWRCMNANGTSVADAANFVIGFNEGSVTIGSSGTATINIRLIINTFITGSTQFSISLYSDENYSVRVLNGADSTVGAVTISNTSTDQDVPVVQIPHAPSSPSVFYTGKFSETSILESGSNAERAANFVVTTSGGVETGTTVGYTISGVSVNDISLSSLTGTITLFNGVGSVSFLAMADNAETSDETLTLTLDSTDSNGDSVGDVSDSIVITNNSPESSPSPSPSPSPAPNVPGNGGDLNLN